MTPAAAEGLRRYLRATRPDCELLGSAVAEACESIAKRAFPGFDFACAYVPVRSRNRRCEYVVIDGHTMVILDIELSDRLLELDLLAQVPRGRQDWIYAFFVVMLGDVFRRQHDLRRYRYCVLKALGDVQSLAKLSALPKDGPPLHAAIAPVLLHELAHIVFRRGGDVVEPIHAMSRATLARFASLSAEQAATGRPPIREGHTLGVPFEQYDQHRLSEQLDNYAATIRNNDELEEELACDFIAALAFISSESGVDCLQELLPATLPISARQLGDIYFLALKTSRYLQLMSGLRQFAINLALGDPAGRLDRTLIEMTSRTNGLTHLLLSLFEMQLGRVQLNVTPDFGRPLTREETLGVMHRSLQRLIQMHHERLLSHFETLTHFFVDDSEFERDNQALLSAIDGRVPHTLLEVDEIRNRLPL